MFSNVIFHTVKFYQNTSIVLFLVAVLVLNKIKQLTWQAWHLIIIFFLKSYILLEIRHAALCKILSFYLPQNNWQLQYMNVLCNIVMIATCYNHKELLSSELCVWYLKLVNWNCICVLYTGSRQWYHEAFKTCRGIFQTWLSKSASLLYGVWPIRRYRSSAWAVWI